MEPAMPADPIIPDRGEFIDALRALGRGRVMVGLGDGGGCVLDGVVVYTAHRPLMEYGLVDEYVNLEGFEGARYYRLNRRGREFADQAWRSWRRRPLLERLAVRLVG
jgi:hypothetical protein